MVAPTGVLFVVRIFVLAYWLEEWQVLGLFGVALSAGIHLLKKQTGELHTLITYITKLISAAKKNKA